MRLANLFITSGGAVASALLLSLCGCHSSYVVATVRNASGGPITLLEVDYPSASFGTGSLADGATFNYRFKVLGSGGTKVLWTDVAHREHIVAGPELHEGEEGAFLVTVNNAGLVSWDLRVHHR